MGSHSVKKVIVNNVNISLNLGQVDIYELIGQLNIGNTYEGDYSEYVEEKIKQKLGKHPVKN